MKQPIRMFIIGLDAEFVEHMTALAVGGVGEVVGSGPRAPETLNSLKEKHPRVCIVDGHGIERSYLDFVRRIHGAVPGVNVIIVGGHDEPPRIARAAASGAWNYVPYTVSRSDFALIEANGHCVGGIVVLAPEPDLDRNLKLEGGDRFDPVELGPLLFPNQLGDRNLRISIPDRICQRIGGLPHYERPSAG